MSKPSHREKKELETNRKFGLVPLQVDAKTGVEISPHIPDVVADVPWYYDPDGLPTLEHQRVQNRGRDDVLPEDQKKLEQEELRKQEAEKARFAAAVLAAAGKTGRRFVLGKKPRQQKKEEEIEAKRERSSDDDDDDDDDDGDESSSEEDEEDEEERKHKKRKTNTVTTAGKQQQKEEEAPAVFGEASSNVSSSGLRDLTELPKYLENLDPGSTALFDPKSRSMRGDPNAHLRKQQQQATPDGASESESASAAQQHQQLQSTYRGDNYLNYGGAYKQLCEQRLLELKTDDMDVFNPTENELRFQGLKDADTHKADARKAMLDRVYGKEGDDKKAEPRGAAATGSSKADGDKWKPVNVFGDEEEDEDEDEGEDG